MEWHHHHHHRHPRACADTRAADSDSNGVETYVQTALAALALERAEEARENDASVTNVRLLEAAGLAVTKLVVRRVEHAVGDLQRVVLEPIGNGNSGGRRARAEQQQLHQEAARELRAGKISQGDIVALAKTRGSGEGERVAEGVVSRIAHNALHLMVDGGGGGGEACGADEPWLSESSCATYCVVRVGSEVTYRRARDALEQLARMQRDEPAYRLREMLFHGLWPVEQRDRSGDGDEGDGDCLNAVQRDAVAFCLAADTFACVHGPPGTGKTKTVCALIRACVAAGQRVLVAAPSNTAVDNVVERLASGGGGSDNGSGGKLDRRARGRAARGNNKSSGDGDGDGGGIGNMVRLGHPARILDSAQQYSLESRVARSDDSQLAADARRELRALEKKLSAQRMPHAERRALWSERRALRKELVAFERRAVATVLSSSSVTLATLSGCGDRTLQRLAREQPFDLVIVDEAGQALEPLCWIALQLGRRAVLAGDPCQLPPTVRSAEAERAGLGRTLLDRVFAAGDAFRGGVVRTLTIQYRMHRVISDWCSSAMYKGALQPDASVAEHLLDAHAHDMDELAHALVLIDTAGCACEESEGIAAATPGAPESDDRVRALLHAESRSNRGEALLVRQYVERMLAAGVAAVDVGVITPYSAQVQLLRQLLLPLSPCVEVSTVDGFQGREKEAIVLSMVRSNAKGDVGFLADDRRTNVAVSRARRHVCVIGNADVLQRRALLRSLVRHAGERGEVRSAAEYGEEFIAGGC